MKLHSHAAYRWGGFNPTHDKCDRIADTGLTWVVQAALVATLNQSASGERHRRTVFVLVEQADVEKTLADVLAPDEFHHGIRAGNEITSWRLALIAQFGSIVHGLDLTLLHHSDPHASLLC